MKEEKIPFDAPLNQEDTENQTKGCRANNPNICANCYMPNVCAFVREDGICVKPSKRWAKQFQKLKDDNK